MAIDFQAEREQVHAVSMEKVLADFELAIADLEAMANEAESLPRAKLNG